MKPEAAVLPDVVLVGASTLLGGELRRELAERRFPLRDITMMAVGGPDDDLGQIVEYAGEPRLIGELDEDRIERADLLFLAAPGPGARQALAAFRRGRGVAVDLIDVDPSPGDPVIHMDVNPEMLPCERPVRIRSPHGAAQILAQVVQAASRAGRVASVSATVLMPASDRGEPGVDELYRQTAGVLSFGDKPEEIFGRQIAFNVVPLALLHRQQGWPDVDRRLETETVAVLGLSAAQVRVRALQVAVFHGTGMMVTVELDARPGRAARKKMFAGSSLDPSPTTPAELGESETVHVVDLSGDGSTLDLWVAADLLRVGGAVNGVRIAESLWANAAVEKGGRMIPRRLTLLVVLALAFVAVPAQESDLLPPDASGFLPPGELLRPETALAAMMGLEIDREIEQRALEADLLRLASWRARRDRTVDRLLGLYEELDLVFNTDQEGGAEEFEDLERRILEMESRIAAHGIEGRRLRDGLRARRQRLELLSSKVEQLIELLPRDVETLTGVWEITMAPMNERGVFTIYQTGTVLSGEYVLDGGWNGSLEGTIVGGRFFVERIDSQKGRFASFSGDLQPDGVTIRGTWTERDLTANRPVEGAFIARKQPRQP